MAFSIPHATEQRCIGIEIRTDLIAVYPNVTRMVGENTPSPSPVTRWQKLIADLSLVVTNIVNSTDTTRANQPKLSKLLSM